MKYVILSILLLVTLVPSVSAGDCAGGICKVRSERKFSLKRTPIRKLLHRK
jgi:hypothetical protein